MRRITRAAVVTLALLALGSIAGVSAVNAAVEQAAIDATATKAIGGSYAIVTGTVTCTDGDAYRISLTLGQGVTGAQARGEAVGSCTGASQPWRVTALTLVDGPLLQPGLARVCWNLTAQDAEAADVRRGCSTVTLSELQFSLGR